MQIGEGAGSLLVASRYDELARDELVETHAKRRKTATEGLKDLLGGVTIDLQVSFVTNRRFASQGIGGIFCLIGSGMLDSEQFLDLVQGPRQSAIHAARADGVPSHRPLTQRLGFAVKVVSRRRGIDRRSRIRHQWGRFRTAQIAALLGKLGRYFDCRCLSNFKNLISGFEIKHVQLLPNGRERASSKNDVGEANLYGGTKSVGGYRFAIDADADQTRPIKTDGVSMAFDVEKARKADAVFRTG